MPFKLVSLRHGLAMQINTTVTHLDLRDNDIDESGFRELMHGLMDNASVTYLDVSNNPGPGKRGMEAGVHPSAELFTHHTP